jgi:tRNA pseudouridine38-40 synthase
MAPNPHPSSVFTQTAEPSTLAAETDSSAVKELTNWKLVLAYDGTDFFGWQVQPNLATVQGVLSDVIERITGERVLPQGSGRTDTGVHALGQVASFLLSAPIPPANLLRALNRALPESIRVLSAEIVPAEFHARHSVIAKTYEYRIFRGEICPPTLARFVYALNWPLDTEAMMAAAPAVVGDHDFTSFAASDPDLTRRESGEREFNCVRIIHHSAWTLEGNHLTYRVTGNGFLHHMVRNLVGTFLEIGRGALAPGSLPEILAARSRSAAGATAPARGLFLVSVQYVHDN